MVSRDVMADETSRAVVLWVKYGWIEAILLSSRYAARHTLLMCRCIDSVWSRWTPRFLTEDLNGIRLPPMSALSLPTELRREVDATGRTSAFSAFSLSFFAVHPVYKTFNAGVDFTEKRLKLIRRNPLWQLGIISVFVIITLMATYQVREGWEYNVNRIVPRTEPCGTPNWRGLGEDETLSTIIDCSQPSK